MERLKKFLKKTFFLSCAFAIGLLLCELLVRLVAPQQLPYLDRLALWEPSDGLGWRRKAAVDTRVNMGEGKVRFLTDELGFRVGAQDHSAPASETLRILMLGDSFLEALQVENDLVINQRLEAKIKERMALEVQVDNAGVSGYNPNHYYLMANQLLDQINYDMGIVLLYVGNDCIPEEVEHYPPRRNSKAGLRFPRSLSFKELKKSILKPLNTKLESSSHLVALLKNRFQRQLMSAGLTEYNFADVFMKKQADTPRWDVVAAVCQKIRNLFTDRGIPVLFVLIPTVYQVDSNQLAVFEKSFNLSPETFEMELPNRQLSERFAARKITYVDALASFRDLTREGIHLYGKVDKHFNAEGHERLAEIIYPIVAANLIKNRPIPPQE